MTKKDKDHFNWLVAGGFFRDVGDGWFQVTEKGKESAELGYYEYA